MIKINHYMRNMRIEMKKKPEYNFMDPPQYEVHWMDAIANSDWFASWQIPEWVKLNACPIKQIGYVLRNDSECIVLASRVHEDIDGDIYKFGGLQWIPKPWIIEMIEIVE